MLHFWYIIDQLWGGRHDVPPSVFNASARFEIKSTTAATWDALANFLTYADWNSFVCAAVIVDSNDLTLPAQRPIEGGRIYFRTQIPPMPLPVSASTPKNLLHTQISYENITHVQPELGRLAWKYLAGERWQTISDLGFGKVLYEIREVHSGALAVVLKETLGKDLQASFEAQGAFGLKLLLEGG